MSYKQIDGRAKTVRELLNGVKYAIDYYQREYQWGTKNVTELLDDLEDKFLLSYKPEHEPKQVQHYPHYFLGSIVICQEHGKNYIIDGQQRLTSLTLLLIYLHNLQQDPAIPATARRDLRPLIFSEMFGEKSFNLDVPERIPSIEALYNGLPFDPAGQPESVQTIVARYEDISEFFPDTLKGHALPYFIDWLTYNVHLVEITAYSDDDAYTIFETMNDRGLSLSPTDMLKGYLLANIDDAHKSAANALWKQRILELAEIGKEEDADFIKAWLRAKYARTIREGKKDAKPQDFEKISSSFNKWAKDEKALLGLNTSADFLAFINDRFARFSRHYLRLREAAWDQTPGLEHVFYNAYNNFTLQYPLILAPIRTEDDLETVNRKMRLVAIYLDIFVARRIWNFRTLGYSAIVRTMFNLMRDMRDLSVQELADLLRERVEKMEETFASNTRFRLHQQNRYQVHYLLARITSHIEEQSGIESRFATYVDREIKKPFEIEHIWADNFERHKAEFSNPWEFGEYRNHIGGLVLLQRGFNQSFGGATYATKLKHYYGQNLLARSLHEQCYENNPSFNAYRKQSKLPFKPHAEFKKVDLDTRQDLYRRIAEEIWGPHALTEALQN
jgi:uncharacterized protein with ParB-like and HNH nuclease domain